MQKISNFSIDVTEVSIEEFSLFSRDTNYKTEAEKEDGGMCMNMDGLKKKAGIGNIHLA